MKLPDNALSLAARGLEPADIVVRNPLIFNPFTCLWDRKDFAIKDGIIIGTGSYSGREELDLHGARVIPGLIDSHVHIESSLLTPREFARLAVRHGTTTVVADPHEIANVLGREGIRYMLADSRQADIDIFFMLPSCVPSAPVDVGGAVLDAGDLAEFLGNSRVLGLGEMMDVPGVLSGDPGVREKLALTELIDGHAPLLSGSDLNAYILNGPQSDHECVTAGEAGEKLSRGMFIYVRGGSVERNVPALVPVVTKCSASRCSFATDDRHADLIVREGHIDALIREAVSHGLELETALKMATLSPAERFHLYDRGAIAPGRVADYCVLGNSGEFSIAKTFRRGILSGSSGYSPGIPPAPKMSALPLIPGSLSLHGDGDARVIGLVPGEIITRELRCHVRKSGLPDYDRDIIKAVACSRYEPGTYSMGLVHGFGITQGAIAGSISHDAHNIIAVGTSDKEIQMAVGTVIAYQGGLAAVSGDEVVVLPLECAGLMSTGSFEDVVERLGALHLMTEKFGSTGDPFMYLSFLALPVIPEIRLTVRGLFSVGQNSYVPLFYNT
ncbi:MAG TPA: adenine deaminase [Methanoregulaceae archaeon]|nr:adenine deaminase [Methanoregulaceae archaeon]